MKKILLFLLLVTYSFSVDGFDKLKWESSPEDFYKYYSKFIKPSAGNIEGDQPSPVNPKHHHSHRSFAIMDC